MNYVSEPIFIGAISVICLVIAGVITVLSKKAVSRDDQQDKRIDSLLLEIAQTKAELKKDLEAYKTANEKQMNNLAADHRTLQQTTNTLNGTLIELKTMMKNTNEMFKEFRQTWKDEAAENRKLLEELRNPKKK